MDYFAVSLPDFLVFDDDLNGRNRIHCQYMAALGYLGLGESIRRFSSLTRCCCWSQRTSAPRCTERWRVRGLVQREEFNAETPRRSRR